MTSSLPHNTQTGFTLLETLVSMFVVAVGLLGVLGMQLQTLVNTQNGVSRGRSVYLIHDLSERMHSSPSAIASLDGYSSAFSDSGGCTNPNAAYTAAALASHDMECWKQALGSSIPGSQAATFLVGAEKDESHPRQLAVMIAWPQKNRETAQSNNDGKLALPFEVKSKDDSNADIECPDGMLCHLIYVQASQRCTSDGLGGASQVFTCMDGLQRIPATAN